MKFTVAEIQKLYGGEALKHGTQGSSTIQDMRTRQLEFKALVSHISARWHPFPALEIGCGNGWMAAKIAERFEGDVVGVDFSSALLREAYKQRASRGCLRFYLGDVTRLLFEEKFRTVYSVRCLQNLKNWFDQKRALSGIADILSSDGEFLMIEGFTSGLRNLNAARAECDLPSIEEPWHNNFLEEESVVDHLLRHDCNLVAEDCFLSGYYFGSRVLLPALTRNKEAKSTSILNDYFCGLPPHGDFCPMKLLRFKKK